MTDLNLNNNASECIQQVNNIGSTVYKNICNDTSHLINWGSQDWISFYLLALLLLAVVVVFVCMGIDIYRDR